MLQFSTAYRNQLLNDIPTIFGGSEVIKIWTGAVPANCSAADTGTLLVTFTLASSADWLSASGGSISLNSLPISATAGNTGTAAHFRHYDSLGNCHMQGTVTVTGGGGDLTIASTNITSGLVVNITTYALTAPGA